MPSGLTTDARHLVCNDDLVSKAGASSSKCGLVFETSSSTDEEDEDSQARRIGHCLSKGFSAQRR